MQALQITNTKQFMSRLLTDTAFDIFLLEEATLSTASTFTIDGHINKEFYTPDEVDELPYDFLCWSEIKSLCFELIKGKRTPLYFKFVLHLKPEHIRSMLNRAGSSFDPSLIRAMVLTIKYDGEKVTLTTGSGYTTFVLDKEPDLLWDQAILKHLSANGISFEVL